MTSISWSRRLRRTPFTPGVEAAGVTGYTVYNHMLLPAVFKGLEADYRHLKTQVQIWDVSVERQVELVGPDAARLMQLLTPRDLRKMKDDQCFYVPVVDDAGGMLNDPVALRVGEDRWWLSIADSDLAYWVKGLALGLKMDVAVREPQVFPLAVQGPRAQALMARVFGDQVRDVGFFRHRRLAFMGCDLIVARSGYSKQGGFEIYVEGAELGMPLWHALFEAGADLNVRAGCPNLIERIEAGLLSYGNDMRLENTPFECGLGRFCDLPADIDHIGKAALGRAAAMGPDRQIRALAISGDPVPLNVDPWPLIHDGVPAGQVTSAAWSPDFQTNVAIAMIGSGFWAAGTRLKVTLGGVARVATVQEKFWL